MVYEIENFCGVYLLLCTNPKYKGRTYIGFTVNPNRRIQQHNRGRQAGGARRTHGKGPWEMVLIIHGFPNMISALRFEWAWTKPNDSRRLRHLPKKKKSEKKFTYCVRVLCEMLRTGPWNRLPLTIRWLKQDYMVLFDPQHLPPEHMPIEFGPVKCTKVKSKDADTEVLADPKPPTEHCAICHSSYLVNSDSLRCLGCNASSHTVCLAKWFLQNDPSHLLPVEGNCPLCNVCVLWGDLIRYKHRCYQNPTDLQQVRPELANEVDVEFQHWADEVQAQL